MIKNVVNHIEDNYTDCQISLSSVADHFNVNEIYLSRFFKEKTGENFSKYIERLRMEKAKELLGDNGLSVSVVAEKVGYFYPQVFRRVFKRYFRKTPSHYKKQ